MIAMNSALRRRMTFWAPLAVVLSLALFWLFRPRPVPVDFAVAQRGPMQVTVSEDGEARVRDVFVVSAPLAGLMRRIDLEVGDAVQARKTVIARIEPVDSALLDPRSVAEARAARDTAAAARSFARAQLQRAQAEYDFAALEYQRIESLAQRQTVSQNERDAAQSRARTSAALIEEARAALKMRESEYEQAQARLLTPANLSRRSEDCDCVQVFSPVSGTVLRVVTESESVVQSGAPLVEVGDPEQLEIVVDLLSPDAVRVREGQRVQIEAWGGEGPLAGKVRRVEPFGFMKVSALGIEEQRVNVHIELVDARERWERLGHGYRVEPRIVLWEANDVLQAPLSALFRNDGGWAVFVAADGRALLRQVGVGRQNGVNAEILSGLEPRQQLILHPGDRVSDGVRITPRN